MNKLLPHAWENCICVEQVVDYSINRNVLLNLHQKKWLQKVQLTDSPVTALMKHPQYSHQDHTFTKLLLADNCTW